MAVERGVAVQGPGGVGGGQAGLLVVLVVGVHHGVVLLQAEPGLPVGVGGGAEHVA